MNNNSSQIQVKSTLDNAAYSTNVKQKFELQTDKDNDNKLLQEEKEQDLDLDKNANVLEFKLKANFSMGLMSLTSIAAIYIFVLVLINRSSKGIIYDKMKEHNLQLIDLSQMMLNQGSYLYKVNKCNSDLQAHQIQGISQLLSEDDIYKIRVWSNKTAMRLKLEWATNSYNDWACSEVATKVRTLSQFLLVAKSSIVNSTFPNGFEKIFGGYADVSIGESNAQYVPGSGKSFAFSLNESMVYPCMDPLRELRGSDYLIGGFGDAFELSCRQSNGDFELNTSQLKPAGNNGAYGYPGSQAYPYSQTAFAIAGNWLFNMSRVEVYSFEN